MISLELKARLENLLSTTQTETADIDIFAPIAANEECPICLIPLPLHDDDIVFMHCCGKQICNGCTYKEVMNDLKKNGSPEGKCAFCRQPDSDKVEGKTNIKRLKKLMKKNNPEAFMQMAIHYKEGRDTIQSDTRSLEMYIRAAELSHANAFVSIGEFYENGIIVEQNTSKALAFHEVGAKKGSVHAHKVLSIIHGRNGKYDKGIKHLTVAARSGAQDSMDYLMKVYKAKGISKEDLTQILRAYQTSSNETKSKDREKAARLMKEQNSKRPMSEFLIT